MELQAIQNKIYEIRGQKVMLDFDLAEMYGTETAQLKRAVRRNIERFPDDFMFTLTIQEFNNLKNNMVCQIGISKKGGNQYAPFAFTEQGIAMLSSVLRSDTAIKVNISIMRASSIYALSSFTSCWSSSKGEEELIICRMPTKHRTLS